MEIMINSALIKSLRKQKCWSQDQLASLTGLSLRTIQRIEKEGKCSMESKRSLASIFEVDANALEFPTDKYYLSNLNSKGLIYGFVGIALGLICSYTGITLAFLNSGLSSGEAGSYFGMVGAFCGISCAVLVVIKKQLSS